MRSLLTFSVLSSVIFAVSALAADAVSLKLSDFTETSGSDPGVGWSTEDGGIIHLAGKGGNLISKLEYADFEMEWDWKISSKGNNGVKYWVTKIGGKEWLGIEYQMIDDNGHPDGMRGGSHCSAAFYDIKEPAADKPLKPVGEWNSSRVVSKNGKLQHWLNGTLVGEADTMSDDWKARIAASKFKNKADFAPGKGADHADGSQRRDLVPQH